MLTANQSSHFQPDTTMNRTTILRDSWRSPPSSGFFRYFQLAWSSPKELIAPATVATAATEWTSCSFNNNGDSSTTGSFLTVAASSWAAAYDQKLQPMLAA
ncbi:unnamed protein product [Linum trigynum]|uniref:Uncharacterized protein n=1 Tax=Linum trigynum TaxID=586398 RepID=A0AAV2CUL8_9ROSI